MSAFAIPASGSVVEPPTAITFVPAATTVMGNQRRAFGMGFELRTATSLLQISQVSSVDAMAMARRLAREEGVFAGTSTGANVLTALRIAERLGPGKTVVTIACDSGMKYLSGALYSQQA